MPDTAQDKLSGRSTTVVGKEFTTKEFTPPGIGTGAAYQDLDVIGKVFAIDVPVSGIIASANYYDLDDEGLPVDLILLKFEIAGQTDNSALALVDRDVTAVLKRIQFTTFTDGGSGQASEADNIARVYNAPSRKLWAVVVARGALNIAAGKLPRFQLTIVADE